MSGPAIDVDSQADCTMALGYDPYDLKRDHVPTLDALILRPEEVRPLREALG